MGLGGHGQREGCQDEEDGEEGEAEAGNGWTYCRSGCYRDIDQQKRSIKMNG